MGIKLRDIVSSKSIQKRELKNAIVAIDGPNIVSALLNYSRNGTHPSPMIDRTQRVISHLYGLLYRVNFLYSIGILPIFCFDGRDSNLKRIITKDLLKDFLHADKLYREAIKNWDRTAAKNIALGKEYMWPNILKESKMLLNSIGVPLIESPASAESQCSQLVSTGIANFANSQDYDSLLFGCPRTLRNLSKSYRRKQNGRWIYEKVQPEVVNLKENLRSWGINRFQLVDIAILVGNDYFSGIRNIGAKTALLLIKKYEDLEGVIRSQRKIYDFSRLDPELIKQVRNIFLLPRVIKNTDKLHWNAPDSSKITKLLCSEHHLNTERVKKSLNTLSKNYNKCLRSFKFDSKMGKTIQKSLIETF
ncbi:MAG: hypothetical protein ACFFAS_14900 [Promethearchaeota archaeon]